MPIDDLIAMQPTVPPAAIDDLACLKKPPQRLSILGRTRNIRRLAHFPSAEALWVRDVNEPQFNEILPQIDPLYLFFEGLRVSDLTPIGNLRRLEALEIRRNTNASDISFLENLTSLRLLALSHCPKVHDLGPIAALQSLEILKLTGGMWSEFRPDTLGPLAQLRHLRGLILASIGVRDQSLAPIAGLKQLQELELSNQFPTEEYARLSVALPHIQCKYFYPYLDLAEGGKDKEVMVTGKGKPFLSLPKDAERLERYVRRFREMQEGFRTEQARSSAQR